MNAANAGQLPILLASKALPEMEAEDARLLGAHAARSGAQPVGAQYEQLGVRVLCCPDLGTQVLLLQLNRQQRRAGSLIEQEVDVQLPAELH